MRTHAHAHHCGRTHARKVLKNRVFLRYTYVRIMYKLYDKKNFFFCHCNGYIVTLYIYIGFRAQNHYVYQIG